MFISYLMIIFITISKIHSQTKWEDGYFWTNLDENSKLSYLQGFFEGQKRIFEYLDVVLEKYQKGNLTITWGNFKSNDCNLCRKLKESIWADVVYGAEADRAKDLSKLKAAIDYYYSINSKSAQIKNVIDYIIKND